MCGFVVFDCLGDFLSGFCWVVSFGFDEGFECFEAFCGGFHVLCCCERFFPLFFVE